MTCNSVTRDAGSVPTMRRVRLLCSLRSIGTSTCGNVTTPVADLRILRRPRVHVERGDLRLREPGEIGVAHQYGVLGGADLERDAHIAAERRIDPDREIVKVSEGRQRTRVASGKEGRDLEFGCKPEMSVASDP